MLPSREQHPLEGERAISPSAAFAEVTIGGAADESMSENGGASGSGERAMVGAGRTLGGARSASPAKRRLEEMEGVKRDSVVPAVPTVVPPPESIAMEDDEPELTPQDVAMTGLQESGTETVGSHYTDTSEETSKASSATSDGDQLPAYSKDDDERWAKSKPGAEPTHRFYTTEETDAQVAKVMQMQSMPSEGDVGVCISNRWLNRVRSRTTEGLKSKQFPDDARDGPVGQLDCSDIVPEGGFDAPILKDVNGKSFVPLKPDGSEHDFEILPNAAYEYIVAEYGSVSGQVAIRRYAHNTADEDAAGDNVQFELHPPVITVRKVPQPGAASMGGAAPALKARVEGRDKFGQRKDTDALRLVSSRSEKYREFVIRAKNAAGIPVGNKTKVFRLLKTSSGEPRTSTDITIAQNGSLTPPASRSSSPAEADVPELIMTPETFKKTVGTDLEPALVDDQSHNDKYNGGGQTTMQMAGFFESMTMILEEQIGGPAGGEFRSDSMNKALSIVKSNLNSKASTANNSRATSPAPGGMTTRGRALKNGKTRGTVGLQNLGNTCYMNSALQCIRSVEELAIYFYTKKYKKDINNGNPLGYHGAMANAYQTVIQGIYGNNTGGSFSPRDFKNTLGRHQPMFSGYGQQDSQEFLSFLVDAIHEDLNRIDKKPYVENPDSDDSKVHDPEYIRELGETYQKNHKLRNDSIAMDLFGGFYKNKMECPDCNKVSVTFDPYSLVTVQLPMEIAFQHDITYIPLHGRPLLHHIDIDKNSPIKALKEVLAKKHPGADASRMWMVEVYNHKIYKVYDDSTVIAESGILANDHLFIFELEQTPKNAAKRSYDSLNKVNAVPADGMAAPQADTFAVPVFQRTKSNQSGYSLSDHPIYITVSREEAKDYDTILKKVLIAVANLTSRPILKEFEEDTIPNRVEELEDEQNGSEESAVVSDHSAQSEDGYVNVSIDNSPQDAEMLDNNDETGQLHTDEVYIPTNFMEPHYFVSPALRNQLFDVQYAAAKGSGMHCADGYSGSFREDTIRPMYERVNRMSRRSSVQSSSSSDSTPGTTSAEEEEADGESGASPTTFEGDEPDIVQGEPATPLAEAMSDDGSDELAGGNTIMRPSELSTDSHRGRRKKKNRKSKNGKKKGGNRNGVITYSQKSRPRTGFVNGSQRDRLGSKHTNEDDIDNPYYIRLGECIVLDWKPEAHESLFGGSADVADDMRGHAYCNSSGEGATVFKDPEQDAKKAKRDLRKKKGVNLDECFDVTSRSEVLSEDNAWYCNRCKELRRATKTLEIWTLPDILVVHLKRFGGNRSFRDKVDLLVDYPIQGLDMTDRVGVKEDGKEYIYDLFAVDNHYGGLGGGHYTAMAKNFYDGQWYDYNGELP